MLKEIVVAKSVIFLLIIISPLGFQTCKLILDVSKSTYRDEGNTRATNSWVEGDKIYLTFTTSNGLSYGDAIYENNSWTVSYYGSLTEGSASKCVAVYFDNPESESSSVVQLTEYTGIYEDQEGIYTFNDGVLAVTANLSPKTGRIKFAGNNVQNMTYTIDFAGAKWTERSN